MGEHMTANEDGTFTVHVHGPVADKLIALLTENSDLREALANSASRETALVEKLKVAIEDEREACAKVCEESASGHRYNTADAARRNCAVLIRMRGAALAKIKEES